MREAMNVILGRFRLPAVAKISYFYQFLIHYLFLSGAGSGIGRGTAYMFAKSGAKMVVTGRNEDKLKETAKKCEELSKQKVIYGSPF